MSQTQPPQAPRDGDPDPSQNPYYQQARAPDLDAGAPTLQAEEAQRLNRKALVFLGGTLLLVLVMGFMLVFGRSNGSDGAPQERQVEARQVIIPEGPGANLPQIPQDSQSFNNVPPIPVEDEFATESLALPPTPASQPAPPVDTAPRQPTLMERRIADNANVQGGSTAGGSGADPYSGIMSEIQALEARQAGGASSPTTSASARPTRDGESPMFLANPDAKLVRGTYLRCVMETRIISDLPGFSSCIVTEPVYSFNGKRLLIPKGSKIYGQYGQGDFMNDRMAVVWDRILTPQGVDISITAPGVDNLGSSGIPGQYDAHWASRITSALMISLLSDAFKYAAAEYGPETTGVTVGGFVTQQPFESNTAETIEQLAAEALEENSKRPPTVTINQGSVINIYVTQDIDFAGVLP